MTNLLWTDTEGSERAAVSESQGQQNPGGAAVAAEEARGQVQRAVILPEEVHGGEKRTGGGQDPAAG